MSVKVNIPAYLQPYTKDTAIIEVNGGTIEECLNDLVKQFPDMNKMVFTKDGKLHDYVGIYFKGEFAYADKLAKPVKNGEELHILYMIGGG